MMTKVSLSKDRQEGRDETEVRARILDAAFASFMTSGYAATSTLEIATRARVSKRELYALVGNKKEMLIACISARATRLQVPADLPVPHDRETLANVLTSSGRSSSARSPIQRSSRSSDWQSPRRSTRPRWRKRSTRQGERQVVPPCVKSWPGLRRPDF